MGVATDKYVNSVCCLSVSVWTMERVRAARAAEGRVRRDGSVKVERVACRPC